MRKNGDVIDESPFAREYDFVLSLGYDCHCASMLRKLGLRSCSSPFDWLTSASIDKRIEILKSRFAGFLKKENLRPIEKWDGAPGKGNDFYEDVLTGLHFYHDFRQEKTFDESYEEVFEKYSRRISRLYSNITSANSTLFVWCDYKNDLPIDSNHIQKRLRAIFDGCDVHFLHVKSDDEFKLIRCKGAKKQRRRMKLMRLVVRLLSWPHLTRASRSAARRKLEKKWGVE